MTRHQKPIRKQMADLDETTQLAIQHGMLLLWSRHVSTERGNSAVKAIFVSFGIVSPPNDPPPMVEVYADLISTRPEMLFTCANIGWQVARDVLCDFASEIIIEGKPLPPWLPEFIVWAMRNAGKATPRKKRDVTLSRTCIVISPLQPLCGRSLRMVIFAPPAVGRPNAPVRLLQRRCRVLASTCRRRMSSRFGARQTRALKWSRFLCGRFVPIFVPCGENLDSVTVSKAKKRPPCSSDKYSPPTEPRPSRMVPSMVRLAAMPISVHQG
jgi:hypothetical protein